MRTDKKSRFAVECVTGPTVASPQSGPAGCCRVAPSTPRGKCGFQKEQCQTPVQNGGRASPAAPPGCATVTTPPPPDKGGGGYDGSDYSGRDDHEAKRDRQREDYGSKREDYGNKREDYGDGARDYGGDADDYGDKNDASPCLQPIHAAHNGSKCLINGTADEGCCAGALDAPACADGFVYSPGGSWRTGEPGHCDKPLGKCQNDPAVPQGLQVRMLGAAGRAGSRAPACG